MAWIILLLWFQSSTVSAASPDAPPERELLRMMEFLQEWEMIQEMELIQQMESADQIEDSSPKEKTETPSSENPTQDGQK